MPDLRPELWLQLGGYAMMLIVAYFGLRQTVAVLSSKMTSLEMQLSEQNKKIEKVEELFISSARYEERQARADEHILLIRKELDDLKHYKGFVNGGQASSQGLP
jgi:hypothetical protein